jgi:integrase
VRDLWQGDYHSWRKTFASALSAEGVPVRVIQELLGHLNLNTTQVYLSVTASQQAQAVCVLERFHERDFDRFKGGTILMKWVGKRKRVGFAKDLFGRFAVTLS